MDLSIGPSPVGRAEHPQESSAHSRVGVEARVEPDPHCTHNASRVAGVETRRFGRASHSLPAGRGIVTSRRRQHRWRRHPCHPEVALPTSGALGHGRIVRCMPRTGRFARRQRDRQDDHLRSQPGRSPTVSSSPPRAAGAAGRSTNWSEARSTSRRGGSSSTAGGSCRASGRWPLPSPPSSWPAALQQRPVAASAATRGSSAATRGGQLPNVILFSEGPHSPYRADGNSSLHRDATR